MFLLKEILGRSVLGFGEDNEIANLVLGIRYLCWTYYFNTQHILSMFPERHKKAMTGHRLGEVQSWNPEYVLLVCTIVQIPRPRLAGRVWSVE